MNKEPEIISEEVSKKKDTRFKDGELNPKAKLSADDVIYIRENYKPRDKEFGGAALGRKFGVTKQQISNIINNNSRKNG